jgi:transcription elongation factor Elf1
LSESSQSALLPKKAVYTCPKCNSDIEVHLTNGLLPSSMKCDKCGTVYYFPINQPPPKVEDQWTPEKVENLIKLVDTLAAKYIDYKKEENASDSAFWKTITVHTKQLTIILAVFLAAIVGLMSYLTGLGKVSGDALLFLTGTITGYILLFIQRLTKGLTSNEKNNAEE